MIPMKNEFDPKAVSFEKIYEEMSHPDRTEIPEMNTVSEARLVYQNLLAAQMELSMKNEELLKTQKELEVSRTRYFALYDFAPLGYVTLNENGFIIEVNFTAATMLGTSKEALISQSFSDVILPEDKILYNYHLKVRSQKNAPQVYTLRLLRRNGAPFWAMVEGPNVYSTKESPVFHLIIRDITRQKNIEELHRENEENDKAPGKDHFALVVRIGADGHFISVNEKYCSLFGKTEAELIGTDITPQVHKEDVAKSRNAWLDLFRSPYSCYFEQRTMTVMGWRWIAWTDNSVLNDRGEVVAIIGVGHDITEQVMIENALRDRNKELECMFALASLFKSNEFSFDEVMNRAVQIIHHSLQFTEHTAVSLTLGDKTFLTADFMESPHMLTQEIVVSGIPSGYLKASFPGEKLPPAREFFLQEQLQFLGEVAKQLSLYVEHDNLKRDLTREKKIVAASDRLKTTFLNNISHEVRSPLNGIIGFGNLLAQTDISQEEKERYTPLLTTSSNRLLSLITDYMDMSLISSGGIVTSYQEVNVKTLLTGLKKRFQYLCDEKKISFK